MSLSPTPTGQKRNTSQTTPEFDLNSLIQQSGMNPLVLGGGVPNMMEGKVGDNQMLQQLLTHPSMRGLFGM